MFFDNLVIHHAHGPLLAETNYYPDGLTMAGIGDQAMLEPGSRFKYQSKELDTALAVDLYDFGARYYDEQTGRFNQLDAASQFASGYVGMGNNWINGTDPNGEYFGWDDLAAGLIGGIYNLTSNLIQGNVHSIGQGFGYFGVGVVSGELALYPQFGGWMASGALLGGGDALLQGKSWSEVGRAAGIGMISSVVGGAVGSEVSNALGGILANIASPVLRNLIGGVVGGYAGGFASGFAASAASGSNLRQSFSDGFKGGNFGVIAGSATSIGMGFIEAKQYDINPWTGRLNAAKEQLEPLSGQIGLQDSKLSTGFEARQFDANGKLSQRNFNKALQGKRVPIAQVDLTPEQFMKELESVAGQNFQYITHTSNDITVRFLVLEHNGIIYQFRSWSSGNIPTVDLFKVGGDQLWKYRLK